MCDCQGCRHGFLCERGPMPYGMDYHVTCGACMGSGCSVCDDSGEIDLRTPGIMDLIMEARKLFEQERGEEYRRHVASLDKLPGALRLFRTWQMLPDGTLGAMVADYRWLPGENVSLNSGEGGQRDSGFYGFSELGELQKQETEWWEKSQSGEPKITSEFDRFGRLREGPSARWYVCGTILGYGHAKLAKAGARVEKAIPECLIEPAGADPDFGMLVVNAAEKYGMKIITVAKARNLETGLVRYWKGRPIR